MTPAMAHCAAIPTSEYLDIISRITRDLLEM